jgi:predicted nucleic acid-binding protein
MTIFVDANFLIALFHQADTFHQQASKLLQDSEKNHHRLLTSNIVLAEATNLIFRLRGARVAQKFLNLAQKGGLEIVFVDKKIFDQAYQLLFRQKSKRGLNLFDCLHLATMQKFDLETILTFDQAFKKAVKLYSLKA